MMLSHVALVLLLFTNVVVTKGAPIVSLKESANRDARRDVMDDAESPSDQISCSIGVYKLNGNKCPKLRTNARGGKRKNKKGKNKNHGNTKQISQVDTVNDSVVSGQQNGDADIASKNSSGSKLPALQVAIIVLSVSATVGLMWIVGVRTKSRLASGPRLAERQSSVDTSDVLTVQDFGMDSWDVKMQSFPSQGSGDEPQVEPIEPVSEME
eukprot:m.83362 g.83362  ORF g.83362 m.83362 type:complete len:211 (+) comp25625_c1_seq1:283-915(+)